MRLEKTSEKVLIWMTRNNITGQQIASLIGITRQAWGQKMKDNNFNFRDMTILRQLGYKDQ